MPTPSPIRDVLQAIGQAIAREMVRLLNENGRYPLRKNSALAAQLLSGDAVRVSQGRSSGGLFAGYNADSTLELFALDYAEWVDTGRKPLARKVPLKAIIQFIKDRNLRYRDKTTGRYSRSRVRLKDREGGPDVSVNKLAFLIQNAIYRNGIRGKHFIQPAFALGEELVDIYLNNQLLDGLTYELDKELNFL